MKFKVSLYPSEEAIAACVPTGRPDLCVSRTTWTQNSPNLFAEADVNAGTEKTLFFK